MHDFAVISWAFVFVTAVSACGSDKADGSVDGGQPPEPLSASAPAPAATPPAEASALPPPGTDPKNAQLAPEDVGFVDGTRGWGWSDRCWASLHKNQLGFAKAQCAEGLALARTDGSPTSARPSLFYNLGLIEERSGNQAGARQLFEQSLDLRPNAEVAAALSRVGRSPRKADAGSCEACKTQEDFDAVMKKGSKCCPVTACTADAGCSGGRVCCKIPGGQLCADEARCQGVNRVSSASTPSASSGAVPGCEPCDSFACLDAADSVAASNPVLALEIAAKGCDLAKCGYLGTVALLRCRGYGLARNPPGTTAPGERDDSMACRELCVGACRSELGDGWPKCINDCEAKRCR